MSRNRSYQVKELAKLAGVTVRTLHHYDMIGLLVPSGRTEAGYRLYHDEDLLRLQQILIGRELGMALEDIKRFLDAPGFDRRAALEKQRRELTDRATRTAEMIRAVDTALATLTTEGDSTMPTLSTETLKTLFEGFDPSRHEDEVRERWGDSNAYRESQRRTRGYSRADWERYREEAQAIMRDAAVLFRSGLSPDSEPAIEVAERHRRSIDRWFYPCPPSMHVMLSELYEADPRFAQSIDEAAPGLTPWLAAAIRANASADITG